MEGDHLLVSADRAAQRPAQVCMAAMGLATPTCLSLQDHCSKAARLAGVGGAARNTLRPDTT